MSCGIYVRVLDGYPSRVDYFRESCGEYPMSMWRKLERVGRGTTIPELLWSNGPGLSKLEKMSISDQRRYLSERIDVLIERVEGKVKTFDKLRLRVQDLTNDQANQVFSINTIRDESAQRAYLESLAASNRRKVEEAQAVAFEKPWQAIGKKQILIKTPSCGMKFGRKDLIEMLDAIEK